MRIIKVANFITHAKKSKKVNEYAVCTTSVGEKEGTTERSKWDADAKKRYRKCLKDVNPKKHKPATKKSDTIELVVKEAKKGKKKKKWMQESIEKPGSFTAYCKSKGYKGVTDKCIEEGKKSPDSTTRRRANLAETFRSQAKKKK
jgi:hypothetical protein